MQSSSILFVVMVLAATVLVPVTARADHFDIAAGVTVLSNSPLYPAFDIRSMFGETAAASAEPDAVIFADGEPKGTIDFVEWQTPTPVEITRFRLSAAADVCTSDIRTFDGFRLLAFVNGDFQEFFSADVPVPYSYDFDCDPSRSRGVLLSRAVGPVTSDVFRAEFRQYLAPGIFTGVRVIELDGYTSNRCGDGNDDTGITASDALVALRTAVGTSACEECICDISGDAFVSATDALVILKRAVGQQIAEHCSSCFPAAGMNAE